MSEQKETGSNSRKYYVYSHWIGDKVYVGFTCRTVHKRLQEHIEMAKKGSKSKWHTALRENGFKPDKTDFAKYSNEPSALLAEVTAIRFYKGQDKSLNSTNGGEGNEFDIKVSKKGWRLQPKQKIKRIFNHG